MRTRFLAVLLVLLTIVPAVYAISRDAFTGKWDATVSPDEEARKAGEKEFKDVLIFKGSQFTSTECVKHGFKATTYEEDSRGGIAATFKCKVKSDKGEGTAEWSGTSTGVDMTGEMKWTKADGTVLNYTFKGTKQPSK